MKTLLSCLSLLLMLTLHALGSTDISESKCWPYRVSLVSNLETDTSPLSLGTTGVLIRAELADIDAELIVDFGRKGIHRVPASMTDVEARIRDIREGKVEKSLPNYVQMLANKFAILAPGLNYKLKLEEFEGRQGYAFLYVYSVEGAGELLDRVSEMKEAESYITLVLPQEKMDVEALRQMIREHPVEAGVFFEHLLQPYQQTLSHSVGADDTMIVTDMDGKLIEPNFQNCSQN